MDAKLLQEWTPSGRGAAVHHANLYQSPETQPHQQLEYTYAPNAEQEYDECYVAEEGAEDGMDDSESEELGGPLEDKAATNHLNYKCKPRRKATQKPIGSDQKRQAFSKRKRGIVLKAYQLYKLTDAKVFMFMVNDKGSSWAYASPSFGASLHPSQLRRLRELAGHCNTSKHSTEVMAHPRMDEADRLIDDRHTYVGALEPLHVKPEGRNTSNGAADPTVLAARAAAQRDRDAQRNMLRMRAQTQAAAAITAPATTPLLTNGSAGTAPTEPIRQPMPMAMMSTSSMVAEETCAGFMGDTIITPSGHALAKAVGLGHHMPPAGRGDLPEPSLQNTSARNNSDQQAISLSQPAPTFTGQVITDAQGNMYRIIQEGAPTAMPAGPPPGSTYMMQSSAMDMMPQQQHHHMMQARPNGSLQVAMHTAATAQHQAARLAAAAAAEDQEGGASGLATLAAAAAVANQATGGSSGPGATSTTSSGGRRGGSGHDGMGTPPASAMMQIQGSMGMDGMSNGNGNGHMMMPSDGGQYMPSNARMDGYMHAQQQHYPQQHQIMQMGPGGPQMLSSGHQHMGGSYTMAAQDMQGGYRSYPPGAVMVVAPDWPQSIPVKQEPQWRQM